ncbi:hypothetical protein, partial [Streptococcus pneumoniae]|uniref:hypothetical protein n=1 Tax=Streptococcus pneumoniae TaxID=1313 RepID=UPI001E42AF18
TYTSLQAATIESLTAAWPTEGVRTVDAASNTPGYRAISGARVNRQSFIVTGADAPVKSVYLSGNNYGNLAFTLKFYQVSDVNST